MVLTELVLATIAMYFSLVLITNYDDIKLYIYIGKEFDGQGHLRSWWSNNTEIEYEKRARCFINSYNQFNFDVKVWFNKRFHRRTFSSKHSVSWYLNLWYSLDPIKWSIKFEWVYSWSWRLENSAQSLQELY